MTGQPPPDLPQPYGPSQGPLAIDQVMLSPDSPMQHSTNATSSSPGNHLHLSVSSICTSDCPIKAALQRSSKCQLQLVQSPSGPHVMVSYQEDPEKVYLLAQLREAQASLASKDVYIKSLTDDLQSLRTAQTTLPPGLDPQVAAVCDLMMGQFRSTIAALGQKLPSQNLQQTVPNPAGPPPQEVEKRQYLSQNDPSGPLMPKTSVPMTYASRVVQPRTWGPRKHTTQSTPEMTPRTPPTTASTTIAPELISDDDKPWQTVQDRNARRLKKYGVDIGNAAQAAALRKLQGNGRDRSDDGVAANFFVSGVVNCPEAHQLKNDLLEFPLLNSDRLFAISRIQRGKADYIYEIFVKATKVEEVKRFALDVMNWKLMEETYDPAAPPAHLKLNQDAVSNAKAHLLQRYAAVYYRSNGAVKRRIQEIINAKGWDATFQPFLDIKIKEARKERAKRAKAARAPATISYVPAQGELPTMRAKPTIKGKYPSRTDNMDIVSSDDEKRAVSAPPPMGLTTISPEKVEKRATSVPPGDLESWIKQPSKKLNWADEVDMDEGSDHTFIPESESSEGEATDGTMNFSMNSEDIRAHTAYE